MFLKKFEVKILTKLVNIAKMLKFDVEILHTFLILGLKIQ